MKNKVAIPLIIVMLCSPLFLWVASLITNSSDVLQSDFFNFWLPSRMNWIGQNPYEEAHWIGGHEAYGAPWYPHRAFTYPLPVAVILAPLGLLPLEQAFKLWIFLSEHLILLSLIILASIWKTPNKFHFVPIVIGVVLFRSTFMTLYIGQLSALYLLILTCVVLCWEKNRWEAGAFLLAFTSLKPSLGGPLLILSGLWLLSRRKWSALLALGGGGFLLLIIGWIEDIHWISEYLSIGSVFLSRYFGKTPNTWGVSSVLCHFDNQCTIQLGVFLSGAILLVAFYLLFSQKKHQLTPAYVVSMIILTTLLITPYIWVYDQILLVIPLVVITTDMIVRKFSYFLAASIFLWFTLLHLALLFIVAWLDLEVWNVILPFIVLIFYIFYIRYLNRPGISRTSALSTGEL